ncbi:MAG: flagellar biosynthetic protein FliO [Pyrinomonadaceae bacterium]
MTQQVATAIWQIATNSESGGAALLPTVLRTGTGLALVCGLCFAVVRVLLPRLCALRPGTTAAAARVVCAITLEPRRRLYVMEIAGQWMVLSTSEAGVRLVTLLERAAAEEAMRSLADAPARTTLGAKFYQSRKKKFTDA